MNLEEKEKVIPWHENADFISTFLLILILSVIFLSQAFATNSGQDAFMVARDILNHNTVYLCVLVYFTLIRFRVGKKYFNFLNLFLILIYFIFSITSVLTLVQSFGILTLSSFLLTFVLFLYMFHVFLRETRLWKELHLEKSPFNEISNGGYFYTLFVLAIIVFSCNLISTTSFNGVVLCLLDCLYIVSFSRYIYLYQDHIDNKNNVVEKIDHFMEYVDSVKNMTQGFLKDPEVTQKVGDLTEDLANEIDSAILNNEVSSQAVIEEKVEDIQGAIADLKDDMLEKTKELEKIDEESVQEDDNTEIELRELELPEEPKKKKKRKKKLEKNEGDQE